MKTTHKNNKLAWEEAYDKAPDSFKSITNQLQNNPKSFLNPLLIQAFNHIDLNNKVVAQFSCNNGRETLAMQIVYNINKVYGFDIASNMIRDAKKTTESLNLDASFIATDILDIDESFNNTFDVVVMMIGAITWFESLEEVFAVVKRVLKDDGYFVLIDGHPLTMMFAFDYEKEYDPNCPYGLQHNYFKTTPFIDDNGMYYMTQQVYESLPFTSYSHTLSEIINSLVKNGLNIKLFEESNLNLLDNFSDLHEKHIPLTFLALSQKK
ncbi:MAG: class I SAM-dependent methyltransferase [Candidatus Izemoplasmataceae bacterium]